MKRYFWDYLFLIGVSGLIITADQITKHLVRSNIPFQGSWSPWDWLPYVRIVNWNNTGVAFGLFQGNNDFFKVVSIIVCLIIIFYFPRISVQAWTIRLALMMQLGGAVGNLIDRFQFGHVVDFISIGSFPVFNIADSCISIGVGILLLGIVLDDLKKNREQRLKLTSSSLSEAEDIEN